MPKVHAIIVAAGTGSRFGGPMPKQFMDLCGMPVVMRAIISLREAVPSLTDTIVLSSNEIERWEKLCVRYGFESPEIVAGGDSRYESVGNAVRLLSEDIDYVMIHDGARPFPDPLMIKRLIDAFDEEICGALPATALTESIREIGGDGRSFAVNRSKYKAVQTPQVFRAPILKEAYRKSRALPKDLFTDDASVMEAAGYDTLRLVDGDPYNIKITNPADLVIASALLANR